MSPLPESVNTFYNSYSGYLKKKFGVPVGKITINAGFSCPNRDGTKSFSGCAFCDNRAFSPVAGTSLAPIEQARTAMARMSGRYGAFIAYLQPFTNTYGPVERLQSIYEPLIHIPGIIGLSIGTRPDCISEEAYHYLGDLAGRTFLTVELGLQSGNDATLRLVNRGHSVEDFVAATKRLFALGIESAAHVILGLPGDSPAVYHATADCLAGLPVNGIKIHQLMIIKGTLLERWHAEGRAPALDIDEYAPILCGFLERLRPDQHIHRIMADTREDRGLISPPWSARKRESLAFLHAYMEKKGCTQGRRYQIQGLDFRGLPS